MPPLPSSFTPKHAIVFVVIAVIVVFAYSFARCYFLYQNTLALEARVSPFNRSAKDSASASASAALRILVLGDSTAVGTGAARAEDSTAGRLAQKYPDVEVVNLAVNGLKIAGLEAILKARYETYPNERFDIVLVQIGANDIIRLTLMKDIEAGIGRILARGNKLVNASGAAGGGTGDEVRPGAAAGKVLVLHSGNVGESKFFPIYLRPILSRRSAEVREIYKKAAEQGGASYVDLIESPVAVRIRENPDLYYASDYLHLSSEGYGLWSQEIERHL